jgi:peroxiredoxin
MALKIGSAAPDFTLKTMTANGLEDVTLSKNFGVKPTVLLFFPFAYTGVCTDEMCDKTGGIAAFRNLNAEVYGISVDSPFAQEAWAKKENITVTLLSDLDKKVITAYDVVFPQIAGIGDASARAAIVIDQAGKVVYAEQTPTPKDLPDFEAVKAVLAKLP